MPAIPHIPDEYLKEEERDGFIVSSMMKRSWATKLKMLCQISEIMERHSIRWYADYGTLLGAVRHRGFVPWDDDLDISLMRRDYLNALDVLEKELPDHYQVARWGVNYFSCHPLSAVNNRRFLNMGDEPDEITEQFYGNPYRDVIDLFPLDYIPADDETRNGFFEIYDFIVSVIKRFEDIQRLHLEGEFAAQIKELLGWDLPKDDGFYPGVCQLISELEGMYTREESMGIENIGNMAARGTLHCRDISWYEETIMLPFETIEVPVPVGYEKILSSHFGKAWCTPVNGSSRHDYPFYRKQQDMIDEYRRSKGLSVIRADL